MKKAFVHWSPTLTFYVEQLPGEGGVDWGYTTDLNKARDLNPYWQKRFNSDCKFCGRKDNFY